MSGVQKILYITGALSSISPSITYELVRPILRLGIREVLIILVNKKVSEIELKRKFGVPAKIMQEKRFSPKDILRTARIENSTLIIIDNGIDQKNVHTSKIKKLINYSSTPLLFMNDFNPENFNYRGLFDNMIFATNWSHSSERAFNYLLTIKEIIGELDIVNVINKKLTIKDLRDLKSRLSSDRKTCLEQNIDAEMHIYAGKILDEILLSARDYKSTIIAMGGKNNKSHIHRLFSKNLAIKTVISADLPVLVVP